MFFKKCFLSYSNYLDISLANKIIIDTHKYELAKHYILFLLIINNITSFHIMQILSPKENVETSLTG